MRDGELGGQRRNKELGPGFNFSFCSWIHMVLARVTVQMKS